MRSRYGRRQWARLTLLVLFGWMLGCGSRTEVPSQGFRPLVIDAVVFWDRQTTESAVLLKALADEFNRSTPGLPVRIERAGTYADIFRKVTASIQARALPAMAVAYESMVVEYIPTGAVIPLDALMHDPELGFSESELSDFYPQILERNRYEAAGGRYYSFPFAKSVLVLYYNRRVLHEAGIESPPQTWDEFLDQCRRIKEKTGKFAYAISVDCSTIDGMIFSMGGQVVHGTETLFNSEEAHAVFALLETLTREKLAYQISPGSFDDEVALGNDQIAFMIRTSSSKLHVQALMNDPTRWGIAPLPQRDPKHPATVLFGPNVVIFATTEEQQRRAWAFVRYFVQPEVQARWCTVTGYLPVRRSVLEHPLVKKSWEEWADNRVPYSCLEYARGEPNLPGWQEVRLHVERAETEVITGVKDVSTALRDLKEAADAALQRHASLH